MYQLLLHGPVHVPEVGLAHNGGLGGWRLDGNLQVNVERVGVGVLEIWKWSGVLVLVGNCKWFQGLHGDNPRRDGGTQVLGSEGSQRYILPLLDIPGTPIIHYDHTKNVFVSFFHLDWISKFIRSTTIKECHLQFKVHQLARTKLWRFIISRSGLSTRPSNWGSEKV